MSLSLWYTIKSDEGSKEGFKKYLNNNKMKRRNFLKSTGCLTIGFIMGRPVIAEACDISSVYIDGLPESLKRTPEINAWLRITDKGRLEVFTGKMELGQGIKTAIAQVAAEELYLPMHKVDVKIAHTDLTPDEGYTAGSGSIDNSAMSVRYAAAAAREKLFAMAALKLNTTAENLEMQDGIINLKQNINGPKKTLTFNQVLEGQQIKDKVTETVKLKERSSYKLVGKAIKRDDISEMVAGRQIYVQDLRFPGMLHARIIRPPHYNSTLEAFDGKALKQQFPTVLKTVIDGSFIGVISADEYVATQVQNIGHVFCDWKNDGGFNTDHESLKEHLRKLKTKDQDVHRAGIVNDNSFSDENRTHTATYFKPYTMHGSVGPSCSIAIYTGNKLKIWSHSQGIYPLRTTLTKLIGLKEEDIEIIGVPGSGCYGHNGADDVSAEAAILALAFPGQYIRLQWSRADEHLWEPYGSAMIVDLKAKLDNNGRITHWQHELWSDTHGTRPGGNPENLLPSAYISKHIPEKAAGFSGGAYRNSQPYYAIENQKVDVHFFEGPLRVSALRSLGAYGNIFAIESFMDELAEKAGIDPIEFRLKHLDDIRAKEVLLMLRKMVKDYVPANKKNRSGTGIAFSRYKNTAAYCAVAAVVSFDKEIIIEKMFSVIDAGEAINTDGLINQTEGGMIQSASWTMQEEVKFNHEKILSVDWKSYPIFRFSQVPETEVVVIDNAAEGPMGAGEAAQGPAAAALGLGGVVGLRGHRGSTLARRRLCGRSA
ncbi:MAG: xanthine dehydrogenase family protein molybdopterin-binding subunit [Chitinophagaceae bacterium]|nr:MAG: xanthine dehydrogenase family protein molybdopterin-binding subunit [Chitinophagaceae bacterium]